MYNIIIYKKVYHNRYHCYTPCLLWCSIEQIIFHSWSHMLPHRQRAVHGSAAFTHLHLALQPFLHPHLNSWQQACEASGSSVHFTFQPPLSVCNHPHSAGDDKLGSRKNMVAQTWPAWYAALFVCSFSAALLGGSPSIGLPFCANSCSLATFTSSLLVRSYSKITNRSRTLWWSCTKLS